MVRFLGNTTGPTATACSGMGPTVSRGVRRHEGTGTTVSIPLSPITPNSRTSSSSGGVGAGGGGGSRPRVPRARRVEISRRVVSSVGTTVTGGGTRGTRPTPRLTRRIGAVSRVIRGMARPGGGGSRGTRTSGPTRGFRISSSRVGSAMRSCIVPPISLLGCTGRTRRGSIDGRLGGDTRGLISALRSFGISTAVASVDHNPDMAHCRLGPTANVHVSGVAALASSVTLGLTTASVEVRTPVPNGTTINVRIPGTVEGSISVQRVVSSPRFSHRGSGLSTKLNGSVSNGYIFYSITGVPRLLVTNAAKSNGSIYVGSVVISVLCHTGPSRIGFLVVSPGRMRFSGCMNVPRLLIPMMASTHGTSNTLK